MRLTAQTTADTADQRYIDAGLIPPDYEKLYDYSRMGDTVITEYGNTTNNGSNFRAKAGEGLCCFAMRRISVRKGRLKEVYLIDTNTGLETTISYDEKGKQKMKQRINDRMVRNAPPYR